jgi:hypothetical protein
VKLRQALALSLAIGAPLWYRQLRYERRSTAALVRHASEWNKEIDRAFSQHRKVWDQTVKEIERAFKEAAR